MYKKILKNWYDDNEDNYHVKNNVFTCAAVFAHPGNIE